MMAAQFFPRSRSFWLVHIGTLFILQAAMWLAIFLWQDSKLFNFFAMLIWCAAFTYAVLLFRLLYQKYQGFSPNILKRTLVVLAYALLAGLMVAVITLLVVTPLLWQNLIQSGVLERFQMTQSQLMRQLLINNTLQSQLFLAIWMFIYISVSSFRRVREAEVLNLRLQNSLKDAHLANLINQLNPHFLFNALNNIRFTMYRDVSHADEMITGLSDMLRYSLESNKQDKLPLRHELDMIERYIRLTKVQMRERLNYVQQASPELHQYLIPPMVLQLLVENAVKHGLEKLRHGGTIELCVEPYGDSQLLLRVSNTRDEQAERSTESSSGSTGIGLANIQSRLQLLYGERASVSIEKTDNNFSVSLFIPRELVV